MEKRLKRGAGILLPVSSLPSCYGIGTLGKEAFQFVDKLKAAGQSYWQVLPVGPTSYGDSPYQSFSAFAGNPYFIDLEELAGEGLLEKKQLKKIKWSDSEDSIDYELIWNNRFKVLHTAFEKWRTKKERGFDAFCRKESFWLDDYALFMACKSHFENVEWLKWDEDIRLRKKGAVAKYRGLLADEIEFWRFLQFRFYKSWNRVKKYANRNGIEIIGDIPIYAALDSADVWAERESFQLDAEGHPVDVAGVPPDLFSSYGQKWGNPLYDWERMEKDGFSWWKKRMSASARLYDVIRFDHFIGVVRYFAIPADGVPKDGSYHRGPGQKLVDVINESLGASKLIAEDLGVLTPQVQRLLKKSGYPGMKVLEFAFDSGSENMYLPHNCLQNSVLYIGTHDNSTLLSYYENAKRKVKKYIRDYMGVKKSGKNLSEIFITEAYRSVCDTVILQMQDILKKDDSARMNLPSTLGTNWKWRMTADEFGKSDITYMKKLTVTFGR